MVQSGAQVFGTPEQPRTPPASNAWSVLSPEASTADTLKTTPFPTAGYETVPFEEWLVPIVATGGTIAFALRAMIHP